MHKRLAASAAVLFSVGAYAAHGWLQLPAERRASLLIEAGLPVACPAGFGIEREAGGERGECRRLAHPETFAEFSQAQRQRLNPVATPSGALPLPGAYRAALSQKAALAAAQATVINGNASWAPYGTGTLIVNDPRYSSVSGDGYVFNSGRIDSFDYDPVNKRLFASLGTGGIWMSTDLGTHWTSIGETLPAQTVGSVAWSSAGGGTVIVASGDPSFGGGDYAGLGAFWSNDLGATWHNASGVPDGVLGFKAAVDHAHPDIVYLALSKGLFRSTDAGRSYVNVALPTSTACAGVTSVSGPCQFANFVTDVVVKEPGGTTKEVGGQVLAAVGYRAGAKLLPGGVVSSPGNGLYRSSDGKPGSYAKLDVAAANTLLPNGFATQERTGRVAFGPAIGTAQNHNYLYAMVQDAVLFNGGFATIDLPESLAGIVGGNPLNSTLFNGLYVSPDFGTTWTRMADTNEIANNPATNSALIATGAALGYSPGIQSYYNLWVRPDPTQSDASGVPTRLAFGLEEVWTNVVNVAQNGTLQSGPSDYTVVGAYRTSTSAATAVTGGTTTHPDQHAGLWVPDTGSGGGVTFVAGNDGGAYVQHVASGANLVQSGWGDGAQAGFNTLLPYGIAVANDGVVWFGLQDNGSGKVDTDGKYYETYGGDGFYVAVDPANSKVAWEEYTNADIRYTLDGGQNWTGNKPTLTGANFATLFVMDPTDAKHLITAGREVAELTGGPTGSWTNVFDLGTNAVNKQNNIMSSLDLVGDSAYVGFCGICDLLNRTQYQFHNGLATNVGGGKPAKRGTADGWHFAAAAGLPNRYIGAIAIDPAAPATVYVTLGGYANRQWVPPGSYLDTNPNIGSGHVFKSIDAGEHFTDITGSLPDASATAIKLRRGQLIVGTDVGAFISSDTNGSSWAPLGTGLPNVPIGQFQTMNNDDRQLFVATYGRGIYKTTLNDAPPGVTPPPVTPPPVTPPPVTPPPATPPAPASSGRLGGAFGTVPLLGLLLGGLLRRRRRQA
ncbi:MAG: hypothetical protein NVS9B10_28500 [Nevskia sp.]